MIFLLYLSASNNNYTVCIKRQTVSYLVSGEAYTVQSFRSWVRHALACRK